MFEHINPWFHEHASDKPIIEPPARENPSPITAGRVIRSFNRMGESNATHIGPVLTSTAELATLVNSSDDIHVAKWTARNTPESAPKRISRREKLLISPK